MPIEQHMAPHRTRVVLLLGFNAALWTTAALKDHHVERPIFKAAEGRILQSSMIALYYGSLNRENLNVLLLIILR